MRVVLAAAQSASVPGDVARNVAEHLRMCNAAAQQGVDLLVFPELSLTGYELHLARANALRPESARLRPLREFAVRARMIVVAGAPLPNPEDGLHIAAFAFLPDGTVATYTKEHVHSSEEPVFTSGGGGPMLVVASLRVGLAICRDASFPEHAAKAAAGGAAVYAVGAMIDVPDYARKSGLLQEYAARHGMAVLLANYSGVSGGEASAGRSAIWDESGRVVAASEGAEEALVIGRKEGGTWEGVVTPV